MATARRRQRRRRHQLDPRPDDRARLVDRRRGSRRPAAVTGSSARRRPARRPTTSRTAARCSSGASTRWRSRSSRRTRSTPGRSSSRGATSTSSTRPGSPVNDAVVLTDGHRVRRTRAGRLGASIHLGGARACSRCCPSRPSSAATATRSAPPDAPTSRPPTAYEKVTESALLRCSLVRVSSVASALAGRREGGHHPRVGRAPSDRPQRPRPETATVAEPPSRQSGGRPTIEACCAGSGSRTSS